MSFDPFEARMQFLQLLRKLNASQQSIHKVVGYAIKYGSKCGEDLWECILEECGKGSLNTRINLLYLLDSLLEVSLPLPLSDAPYPPLISTNLGEIVRRVVPEKEGVLNLRAAKQILESWRTRRLIEPEIVGDALKILDGQNHRGESSTSTSTGKRGREAFSRGDIVRRMEEDRERHKRLRERIWILPIPPLAPSSKPRPPISTSNPAISQSPSTTTTTASQSPYTPQSPAPTPATRLKNGHGVKAKSNMGPPPPPTTAATGSKEEEIGIMTMVDPLDVEFDQLWEGGSDLDPDDLERMKEDSIILTDLEKEKS